MQGFEKRAASWGAALLSSLVIAGCATHTGPAPVEDRSALGHTPAMAADSLDVAVGKPLPGIENLGKPGYYQVRPGDTVRQIARETSQNWRDIVQWNQLDNPDRIEVGQVLRVVPPVAGATTSAPTGATSGSAGLTTPVGSLPSGSAGASTASVTPTVVPSTPKPTTPSTPPPAGAGDEGVNWMWPAQGALLAGYDEVKNKGFDIGGKAGDPVLAAAEGQVVYAGAGLRGYGNLIILKHNNTYLTAYAHNRTLLVKEDERVRRGQKIAEMGNSDADRVKLHFEIRRQGKPVDPARYLPSR